LLVARILSQHPVCTTNYLTIGNACLLLYEGEFVGCLSQPGQPVLTGVAAGSYLPLSAC
jgi:hypothetical protein